MSFKQVAADLSGLPDRLLEAGLQALVEQAQLIKGLAQVAVRVDTGSLRDSGRVERGGKGKRRAKVSVRFGGYIVNPRTGRLVDYAAIVESRYPFLKPAVDAVKPQIDDVVRQFCLQQIRDVESYGVLKLH